MSDIVITPVSDSGTELLGLMRFEKVLDEMSKAIRPKKLEYRDVNSAGKQIFADFDTEFNMAEFKKLKGLQMIATEPWIQFEPQEWTDSMDQIFTEMVDLWNQEYSKK